MSKETAISVANPGETASVARLIALVLDGITSEHSRLSYRTGLVRFFGWIRSSGTDPAFTKVLVGQYRSLLLADGLSPASINLRLSPLRKPTREMADN